MVDTLIRPDQGTDSRHCSRWAQRGVWCVPIRPVVIGRSRNVLMPGSGASRTSGTALTQW